MNVAAVCSQNLARNYRHRRPPPATFFSAMLYPYKKDAMRQGQFSAATREHAHAREAGC